VFVAYPYRLYPKAEYRNAYKEIAKSQDVSFVFAEEKLTSVPILERIATLRGSEFAIFDVSGWTPNVALELGFGMALSDRWYVALDPSKTDAKEIPAGLRGLGRIEYRSLAELSEKLKTLLNERAPQRAAEPPLPAKAPKTTQPVSRGARIPRGEQNSEQVLAALNDKEKAVLDLLRRRRTGLHLEEIGAACFSDQGPLRANSWARNSVRRLVASELIRKMGRGMYIAVLPSR
jgi:hypothetical protein